MRILQVLVPVCPAVVMCNASVGALPKQKVCWLTKSLAITSPICPVRAQNICVRVLTEVLSENNFKIFIQGFYVHGLEAPKRPPEVAGTKRC